MKHLSFLPTAMILLSSLFSLASCTNGESNNLTPMVIENNMKDGSWRITSFIDSGQDETNHFSGYTFTFGTTGAIIATNGSITHTGVWSITDSNSHDDNPDDLHFNIFFNHTNTFEDLNEDWNIVTQSSNRIELIHVSGGNGGTDFLTFVKI